VRFRIHPKAYNIAHLLSGATLIDLLKVTFDRAARISSELRDCKHFTLLDQKSLDDVGQTDEPRQVDRFWQQINQLLLVICRTSSRAVQNLVDGLSFSIGSRNELTLALAARSLIEHAAALHDIGLCVQSVAKRLVNEVWPNHRTDSSTTVITDVDQELRRGLVRFAVGRRVQFPGGRSPTHEDSRKKWEEWTKSLRKVPEEYKAKQVLDSINSLTEVPGNHHLRAGYEFLCEYCHPNGRSRTLEYRVTRSEFGKHHLTQEDSDGFSKGFRDVFSICCETVPPSCKAIDESLALLSGCLKPMPRETFGLQEPPIYGVRMVDEFGRVGWLERGKVAYILPERKSELSEGQIKRVARIHEVFDGLHLDLETGKPMTLERHLELFSCEAPFIEEEISIWEHFVDVFQNEITRPT
jgi:hypothetical protein